MNTSDQQQIGYYRQRDAEDGLKVVASHIAGDHRVQVIYRKGVPACADMKTGNIYIPVEGSALTGEALSKLRLLIYHESGHIAETGKDFEKAAGALGDIQNALEDVRMEKVVGSDHVGCRMIFDWGDDYYNKKVGSTYSEVRSSGKDVPPVGEALCAMMFKAKGLIPSWTLGEVGQEYVDLCYGEFSKVLAATSTTDVFDLADRIYELMKLKKEEEREQEQDSGDDSGQPQDGDEEADDQPQDKDDGDDEDDDSGQGQDEGDDEARPMEDDDSDQGKDKGAQAQEGDDDDDDDQLQDQSGQPQGDADDEDDESTESNGGSDSPGSGEDDSEADRGKTSSASESIEDELDAESEYEDRSEMLSKEIEKDIDDLDVRELDYLPCRDLDEHMHPDLGDMNRKVFTKMRSGMAAPIMGMSRALEQALRAVSRKRQLRYQERGKLDKRRLAVLAKGLSKQVFRQVQHGRELDTAVGIVIDESGSMVSQYYNMQCLAIALGETLSAIGVPFEIVGGTTKYGADDDEIPELEDFDRTNPIIYRHYKNFSDDWRAVRHRVVNIRARIHYADGELIDYMSWRLGSRPERRKVIFSLTDGEPYYGQLSTHEAGSFLKRACSKARASGVEVYGFGIGTKDPKKYYGKDFFIYLNDMKEMNIDFFREFAKIVTKGSVKIGR